MPGAKIRNIDGPNVGRGSGIAKRSPVSGGARIAF